MRQSNSIDLTEVVRLATPSSTKNPDQWKELQGQGLGHVVRSLQIAAMGAKLVSVGTGKIHGVVCWNGQSFDVMAVRASTHQDCERHVAARPGRRQRRHLLLVSKDEDNTRLDRRQNRIDQPRRSVGGPERRYTDGWKPSYQIGYQDMIEILGSAKASSDVAEELYAF